MADEDRVRGLSFYSSKSISMPPVNLNKQTPIWLNNRKGSSEEAAKTY